MSSVCYSDDDSDDSFEWHRNITRRNSPRQFPPFCRSNCRSYGQPCSICYHGICRYSCMECSFFHQAYYEPMNYANHSPNVLGRIFHNHNNAPDQQVEILAPDGEDTIAHSEKTECVICCTNEINTIFMPCCHIALCIGCSKKYHSQEKSRADGIKCLICKQPVSEIKRVYKP